MNQDLSRFYAPNSDFYSEIQELTQILLRISEAAVIESFPFYDDLADEVLLRFAGHLTPPSHCCQLTLELMVAT